MIKFKSVLLSLSLLIFSACSQDNNESTENLRKIGAPIEGKWQVADHASCKPDANTSILITPDLISSQVGTTTTPLLKEMQQLKSTRFVLVKGILNSVHAQGPRTIAYNDKGDRLEFAGFIVNNELIKRKTILEKYNTDGNAEKSVKSLDFNFCSKL